MCSSDLIHVTGYENLWRRLINRYDVEGPAFPGLDIDTSVGALELAAAGHGPAIVLDWFAESYIASGRLAPVLDQPLTIEPSHYLVTAQGARRPRPEAVLFRDWLIDQVRAHEVRTA